MDNLVNYKYGTTYRDEISPDDASKFAELFGEGSPALTALIKYCIENGIKTIASCKGHPEDRNVLDRLVETGYISFEFYDTDNFAKYLAEIPLSKKGITSCIDYDYSNERAVTLYVPANKKGQSEEYFKYILDKLKEYNVEYVPNIEVSQIVDYVFSYPTNEIFEIKNNKYNKIIRNGYLAECIAKCPISKIHKDFSDELKKQRKLDEFINSTKKGH